MLTRCPDCATHFRVTAEQLKLRAGRVRCGECQNIFNALDTLIEEPAAVFTPPPAAPVPVRNELPTEEFAVAPAPTFGNAEMPDAVPGLADQPPIEKPAELPEEDGDSPCIDPGPEAPHASIDAENPAADPAAENKPVGTMETQDFPVTEPEPWEDDFVAPLPPPRRWPWIVGGFLAMVALGLQALLMFRVEIAVLWPESRQLLVAACETLGCEVALPAKVALVGIEASDLHPDAAQKGRLTLTATLKNRAPFVQQFPHLELSLTDTTDKAIVRKVLAPADYLPRTAAVDKGMTPNADLAVSITLDAGDLPASGYRLYIFYP